jgi:hypothetical protein
MIGVSARSRVDFAREYAETPITGSAGHARGLLAKRALRGRRGSWVKGPEAIAKRAAGALEA